jgi:hypothetical protein
MNSCARNWCVRKVEWLTQLLGRFEVAARSRGWGLAFGIVPRSIGPVYARYWRSLLAIACGSREVGQGGR